MHRTLRIQFAFRMPASALGFLWARLRNRSDDSSPALAKMGALTAMQMDPSPERMEHLRPDRHPLARSIVRGSWNKVAAVGTRAAPAWKGHSSGALTDRTRAEQMPTGT